MIYPISYSFPKELMVPIVPFKSQYDIKNAYGFNELELYMAEYRKSIFGATCLKCGWDCLRHYEILSQGTITNFTTNYRGSGLKDIPARTMTTFPKQQIGFLMNKYGNSDFETIMRTSSSDLYNDLDELLQYTRTKLTTEANANYLYETTKTVSPDKLLFITNHAPIGDYILDMTAHGFKLTTNGLCDIFPDYDYRYKSYPLEESKKLYGKGFNYTRLLDDSLRNRSSESEIAQKIKERFYEKIFVYISHDIRKIVMPFPEIYDYYESDEISLICGNDCDPMYYKEEDFWYINMWHECHLRPYADKFDVFIRELGN